MINQISAGEVVERPANMVKELVENSLDAKADKIEVHFDEGGCSVQVKDNGRGISESDLLLALAPHSTSKITSVEDLWKINSFGFRGEALASIAQVSDLLLISKPSYQKQAAKLHSVFGQKKDVQPTGAVNGTTIIVKNLFQNTPVRKKFLRSSSSEVNQIKNTLKALALAHPKVEFKVFHKNQLLFYWTKKQTLKERVQDVLPLKKPFYIHTKYENIQLTAILCSPNEVASNRKHIWFFVNNRWVENTTLYSALLSAYRGLLMHGEYPIAVLKLLCPTSDCDVNVHPSKMQVRFKNPSLIFRAVYNIIRNQLHKTPWLKELQSSNNFSQHSLQSFSSKKSDDISVKIPISAYKNLQPINTENNIESKQEGFSSSNTPIDSEKSQFSLSTNKNHYSEDKTSQSKISFRWSSLHVLSQTHLTYIITQSPLAVIFIDQHAAHERILYERLMQSWKTHKPITQNRLIPLVINMDESLIECLFQVKKDLLKLGINIQQTGPENLVVLSAPPVLKDQSLQKTLLLLADEIKTQGMSFAIENSLSNICATMACHSAIRAGQSLSHNQMKELINQMDEFPFSSFCPHGRPVFVEYPIVQMEKDFGRRN